jgi:hypothetical protein
VFEISQVKEGTTKILKNKFESVIDESNSNKKERRDFLGMEERAE